MSLCQIFYYFIKFNLSIKLTEFLFLFFVNMLHLVHLLGEVVVENPFGVLLGCVLPFTLHYEFSVSDLGEVD